MRILALYPFLPYPRNSGARLRGCSILEILCSEHEVTLVSLLGRDDSPSQLLSWPLYTQFAQPPITAPARSTDELTTAGQTLRALRPASRLGIPEYLDHFDSPAMWNRLAELDLEKFDAVHVRYMYMSLYALALKRAAPDLRLVVDVDDILSVTFFRRITFPKRFSKVREAAWELKELLRIYAFERGPLRLFDSIWTCSKLDERKMIRRVGPGRTLVVENVVDAKELSAMIPEPAEQSLLFVGDFNYAPNREGAEFLLEEVWPAIRREVPNAQLWLVGINNHAHILGRNGQDGIVVTGAVEEISPYLRRATVAVAPLLLGSGTRLKILEALGAGVPVVATSAACEGIDAENGVHLLIADNAKTFIACCLRLLKDNSLRAQLAKAGRELIRDRYDVAVMSRAVLGCYRSLSESKQSTAEN
jgi:glycosyltransferase involved in cell wall biosynthesis